MKVQSVGIPKPSVTLLVKLGSIAVHAEELISPSGHPFDREVLVSVLADEEVSEWLGMMNDLALLPIKRGPANREVKPKKARRR